VLDELVVTIQATGRLPPAVPQDESEATFYAAPTEAQLSGSLWEAAAGRLRRLAAGRQPLAAADHVATRDRRSRSRARVSPTSSTMRSRRNRASESVGTSWSRNEARENARQASADNSVDVEYDTSDAVAAPAMPNAGMSTRLQATFWRR